MATLVFSNVNKTKQHSISGDIEEIGALRTILARRDLLEHIVSAMKAELSPIKTMREVDAECWS